MAFLAVTSILYLGITLGIIGYCGGGQTDTGFGPLTLISLVLIMPIASVFNKKIRTKTTMLVWGASALALADLLYCIYRINNWIGNPGNDAPWYFCCYVLMPGMVLGTAGYLSAGIMATIAKVKSGGGDNSAISNLRSPENEKDK
jgi:hypothetical protein